MQNLCKKAILKTIYKTGCKSIKNTLISDSPQHSGVHFYNKSTIKLIPKNHKQVNQKIYKVYKVLEMHPISNNGNKDNGTKTNYKFMGIITIQYFNISN